MNIKKSKKLSYFLRHNPEGMTFMDGGWIPVSEILDKLKISMSVLETIVASDTKGS